MAKNILVAIGCLIVAIFLFTFITNKNPSMEDTEDIQEVINGINAELPIQLDSITTYDYCELNTTDTTVIYHYSVKGISANDINTDILRKHIVKNSLYGSVQQKKFFEYLVKNGLGVTFSYEDSANNSSKVRLSPEELKKEMSIFRD